MPPDFGVVSPERKSDFPKEIASGVKILDVRFGRLDSKSGKAVFQETDRIKIRPGEEYGWLMKVETTRPVVTWVEEFELPRMPLSWGASESRISDDQKTSVSTRTIRPDDGIVWNFWQVAFGDPVGEYKMRVFVEDVFVREFRFQGVEP